MGWLVGGLSGMVKGYSEGGEREQRTGNSTVAREGEEEEGEEEEGIQQGVHTALEFGGGLRVAAGRDEASRLQHRKCSKKVLTKLLLLGNTAIPVASPRKWEARREAEG